MSIDPWTMDEDSNNRLDPQEILKRLLHRLNFLQGLNSPYSAEGIRMLEIRIAAQRQRIEEARAAETGETFAVKLERLKLARFELGKWLALIRRLRPGALELAMAERRFSYLSKALRMMRETGCAFTGLPSIDEIHAEVIDDFNTGKYWDELQQSNEELTASWFSRPAKPKL